MTPAIEPGYLSDLIPASPPHHPEPWEVLGIVGIIVLCTEILITLVQHVLWVELSPLPFIFFSKIQSEWMKTKLNKIVQIVIPCV